MSDVNAHQEFQAMPQLNTPFLEGDGTVNPVWQQLLIRLWQGIGGTFSQFSKAIFMGVNTGGNLSANQVHDGQSIGEIAFAGPGLPAQAVSVAVGASPFSWTAPGDGFVVATLAQLEVERQGVRVTVSLMGGAMPLRQGDIIHLTWFGSAAPQVTWFQNQNQ